MAAEGVWFGRSTEGPDVTRWNGRRVDTDDMVAGERRSGGSERSAPDGEAPGKLSERDSDTRRWG